MASSGRSETFFKIVDAVIFGIDVRKTVDAVKIVFLKAVLGSVFNHVPLNGVLGIVVFHVFFVAAAKEVDDFVAVEDKHGGTERRRA